MRSNEYVPSKGQITFGRVIDAVMFVLIILGALYLRRKISWFEWGHVFLTLGALAYFGLCVHLGRLRVALALLDENRRNKPL